MAREFPHDVRLLAYSLKGVWVLFLHGPRLFLLRL